MYSDGNCIASEYRGVERDREGLLAFILGMFFFPTEGRGGERIEYIRPPAPRPRLHI